ncbi:kinase-like domain-containing protein [Rhizophagus clarus]|uniref:Kinase-like domain-containing protein n=1 Tax=Rhizophagus clarus TaxID=94130 RepID=A0A8H3QYU6_9GLOM|nr:kinase-like domain-containing protein [Rhizophagus clarus]
MSSSSQIPSERCEICGEYYENYSNAKSEWCKPCLVNDLKGNFSNWTSENEKIDNYIQEMQLKINNPNDMVFEWIPYNQFNNIREDVKGGDSSKVCSAIWKDGPLSYSYVEKKLARVLDKKVALKRLCNLQNNIGEFLNEVINFSNNNPKIYGISQNPDTKDYILVLHSEHFDQRLQNIMSSSSQIHCERCEKCGEYYENDLNVGSEWCKTCLVKYLRKNFANMTSGNEKIDNLIQEMQSKIDGPSDIVFEWIQYNQFNNIREDVKDYSYKVYSAIWKGGPLSYSYFKKKLTRMPSKKVALKCLNLQNNVDEFLKEVEKYSVNFSNNNLKIYGISQNPDTKDYILVLHNEYFEKCCKKCGKDETCAVYSAVWKDGPLHYEHVNGWTREPDKKIALKFLQNTTNEFLNELKHIRSTIMMIILYMEYLKILAQIFML